MIFQSKSVSALGGGLVRRPVHHVDFFCPAPRASSVMLVGDFNDWDAHANPMQRLPDGGWWLRMALTHGHHQYCYLVDGKPTLDQRASGTVRNGQGAPVSLIAVS